MMIREPNFLDADNLFNAIQTTFNHRRTSIILFIKFDQSGMQNLQTLWNNHLRGLGMFRARLNLPNQMSNVIEEINDWLAKIKTEPKR